MTENDTEQEGEEKEEAEEGSRISYVSTTNVAQIFQQKKFSLFVTTYQADRVLLFSAPTGDKLSMLMRKIPRSTGIALGKKQLAVASKSMIRVKIRVAFMCFLLKSSP